MHNRVLTALALPATALSSFAAYAQTTTGRPDYWHYAWDWGWGHMLFGAMMMILFWGGIIVFIVLAVRWFGGRSLHGGAPPASRKPALDILEERFAKGEIDNEEFEERKRLLSD